MIADSSRHHPPELNSRTVAYLRACGLPPAAAARAAAEHDSLAATLEAIDRWSEELSPGEPGEPPLAARLRARARLLLAGAPARDPRGFLDPAVPAEVRSAIARAGLESAPDLHQTAMTPQPINLGPLSDVADETWRTFDKWPVLRGIAIWTLFGLLLGIGFYLVRF